MKTFLQGPTVLQTGFYWILLITLGILLFNYPAGMSVWGFSGTVFCLATLLAMNLFWLRTDPNASLKAQSIHNWAFLLISAALVLGATWISGQEPVIYLLIMVCAQASFKLGAWPAGAGFGGVFLLVELVYQLFMGAPLLKIIPVESALGTGIISVLFLMTLLKRYAQQTERAESLLKELQIAHHDLEAAQQKEKDLAVAEERLRLARELHDSVTQSIYSLNLYAEAATELLSAGDTQTAAAHLHEIRDAAQSALREMRLLIFELHRPALAEGGLAGALAGRLEAVEKRAGVHSELQVEGVENLPAPVQTELYSIAQEALNNALKHSHAEHVQVLLRYNDDATILEICDDGKGFDPPSANRSGGFGIPGMRERARKIGGTIKIESAAAAGTKVIVQVPGVVQPASIPAGSQS